MSFDGRDDGDATPSRGIYTKNMDNDNISTLVDYKVHTNIITNHLYAYFPSFNCSTWFESKHQYVSVTFNIFYS